MSAPIPPKRMKVAEIAEFVEFRTGSKPTLQTVYNWINNGKAGIRLKTVMGKQRKTDVFPNIKLTTAPWIDEFLAVVERKVRA